jgi:pyruvate dehydrogenase E2 component (dihydrolipoamide acetyltransferase)
LQLTTMRKTIARRMTDSFRDVPQFALNMDVELDRMLECRTRINAQLEPSGLKVSVTDFVLKAAALALMRVPEVNASYTSEGIIMHPHADVALAVALPDGLVAPVLRQVEAKGLAAIAREARELTELARTKRIEPRHIEGGTFSVSNLGMLAVKSFTSIINAPHAAILSVGAAEARPVIKLGQVAIATMMTVTLTCDHRAIDGATGARWLREFKASIEEPATMLA